jgi:ribonuclease P protein subunit POP4
MTEKVYPHELIGETIEIVDSTNKSHMGLQGKVIDETKSTIVIEQQSQPKTLLKNNITLRLKNGLVIKGTALLKRPEDRIKG